MTDLKSEFKYYTDHKADFLAKYLGRFVVLKDHAVIGTYDERIQAIKETISSGHELGTFLVQHVVESEEETRFHSRYAVSSNG